MTKNMPKIIKAANTSSKFKGQKNKTNATITANNDIAMSFIFKSPLMRSNV